jgi:Mg2+ and Co2+ transporter CorA
LPGGSSRPSVAGPGKGAIRTRPYRDGVLIKENFPAENISDQLQHKTGCLIWLDLCEPDREQLGLIGSEFALHKWRSKMRSTKRNAPRWTGTAPTCSCPPIRPSRPRAVESLDNAVEETEDGLFDHHRDAVTMVQRKSFQLRKSLVLLRRITLLT